VEATVAVILAAGQGTRMKSDLPKVLHAIDGRPMVSYVIDTVRAVGVDRILAVIGYQAERVRGAVDDPSVEFVLQVEQLGTGHAVVQCEPALNGFSGTVVVLSGDVPGLRAETLRSFIDHHRRRGAAATVMTARVADPTGYGRIVRSDDDTLSRIVEHKDADPAVLAIDEINAGLYCFENAPLFEALRRTDRENAQNEYYLTDVVEELKTQGLVVEAYCVEDEREVAGVNTVAELDAMRAFMLGDER
jgi:bifunctional UDP-N-acetylglucosamine pyrophosphorylase/glucosamine-1-phosphate N-acetyltransferase